MTRHDAPSSVQPKLAEVLKPLRACTGILSVVWTVVLIETGFVVKSLQHLTYISNEEETQHDREVYRIDLKAPPAMCLPSPVERNNSSGPGRTLKEDRLGS